ncbi:FtsX-like permease family protein [Arthrobacter sp.]|uniref:FtsX-like permease family protein n=1 Tax=Arthrobacter sp. TaxID=1667 RepID=UPI0028111660|nr:FtsX-like permease family protein [Arthrobacter sp.]
MLRVALSQLTTHARRFIAVGLAVMLSVAFLSTTLMVSASTQASLGSSLGETYRKADLIASPGTAPLAQAAIASVSGLAGVSAVYGQQTTFTAFGVGREEVSGRIRNLAPDALEPSILESGRYPQSASEVAVDADTVKRYGLQTGGQLVLKAGDDSTTVSLTVSGVLVPSNDPFASALPQLLAQTPAVSTLAGDAQGLESIQVVLADGDGDAATKGQLAAALAKAGAGDAVLRTATEQVTYQVAQFSSGKDELTVILLAFAGVALVVSALVVSNTFAVLVAQRTRELALLRCLGAGRSQIRGSVLLEALLVGAVSSVAGVLAGAGLMYALIAWARSQPDMAFATLAVPPSAIFTALAVGMVLTVLAALVPARAATAVAPLAALRPADPAALGNRKGRLRLIGGLFALLGGAGALGLGASSNQLLLALAGGALSFLGVLLCATLFVPRLVALAGRLAAPSGVPGHLAARNAVRNPGRTSVTAAALLIGVTLVALMMTGASSARMAFDQVLAQNYPVDMAVLASPESPKSHLEAVRTIDGVKAAALLPEAGTVKLDGADVPVYSLAASHAGVLRDSTLRPEPGKIYLPEGSPATAVTMMTVGGNTLQLEPVVLKTRNMAPLVDSGSLSSLPDASLPGDLAHGPVSGGGAALWLLLDKEISGDAIRDVQQSVATALGVPAASVSGAAIERVTFNEIIDVLLLVVTGLLGVAIVIALIGVANTLSLSVLERTRENSLLRALGLTRGQLRGMLAIEAALVAGVAAVLGTVLGVVYGWLGAKSALGSVADVVPAVPWLQLLAVFGVAIVAGLLASVMPARRAARLSPVEGLAAT